MHYLREDGKEGLTWFKDFHNTFRFIRRGDEPYREAIMASLITVQDLKKALASFPNNGYLEIRVDPSGSAGVAYLDRETRKYTTVWERS